jgi:tRNA uridine 5-carboxymethylaminomethyl modification enzyme
VAIGAAKKNQEFLTSHGSTPLGTGVSLSDIIRRPEFTYETVEELDPERPDIAREFGDDITPGIRREIKEQINITIKYQGYIDRQMKQVLHFQKMEKKKIPADIDYSDVRNLRIEARQKLEAVRPESIGQASRISGVSPADINMLMLYLKI